MSTITASRTTSRTASSAAASDVFAVVSHARPPLPVALFTAAASALMLGMVWQFAVTAMPMPDPAEKMSLLCVLAVLPVALVALVRSLGWIIDAIPARRR